MSGVPYHAWTHRPKAQGGTDPVPGAVHLIEWSYTSSSTDWIDDEYVQLVWGGFIGSAYDQDTPTFNTSGDDNILVAKAGVYRLELGFVQMVNNVNVSTIHELYTRARVGGAQPHGWHPWPLGGSPWATRMPTRINPASVADLDISSTWWPVYSDLFSIRQDELDDDGPAEIEVWGAKEEDNDLGPADTLPIVRALLVRLGAEYGN